MDVKTATATCFYLLHSDYSHRGCPFFFFPSFFPSFSKENIHPGRLPLYTSCLLVVVVVVVDDRDWNSVCFSMCPINQSNQSINPSIHQPSSSLLSSSKAQARQNVRTPASPGFFGCSISSPHNHHQAPSTPTTPTTPTRRRVFFSCTSPVPLPCAVCTQRLQLDY
jgi:hypothetical protein